MFSRVATTLKEKNSPVQLVGVDAAENPKVADLAQIETLPTFKMFVGGKVVGVYDGDRSFDDLLKFCEGHSKVKDEL